MTFGNIKSSLCLLVLTTVASSTRSTEASLITWEFAGEISIVADPDNQLDGAIVVGSPFSGSFTYESTTPDEFPNALDNGSYPGALTAASGQVGGISFSAPVGIFGDLRINKGVTLGGFDTFGVDIGIVSTVSPVKFINMHLSGADVSGTIFVDDSIPLFPPDVDMLDLSSFILQDRFQTVWVRGELTSIVPEPTSLMLLALGGALACRR